jgi:hypothetical protein
VYETRTLVPIVNAVSVDVILTTNTVEPVAIATDDEDVKPA